jgi:hypothetical protein
MLPEGRGSPRANTEARLKEDLAQGARAIGTRQRKFKVSVQESPQSLQDQPDITHAMLKASSEYNHSLVAHTQALDRLFDFILRGKVSADMR